MALPDPTSDGLVQAFELPGKEMIRALEEADGSVPGHVRDHRLDFFPRAILVAGTLNDQFWLPTFLEVGKVRTVHRNSQPDQFLNTGIGATHLESDPTSETEPSD